MNKYQLSVARSSRIASEFILTDTRIIIQQLLNTKKYTVENENAEQNAIVGRGVDQYRCRVFYHDTSPDDIISSLWYRIALDEQLAVCHYFNTRITSAQLFHAQSFQQNIPAQHVE